MKKIRQFTILLSISLIAFMLFTPVVEARDMSDIEREIAENEEELKKLEEELKSKQSALKAATAKKNSSTSELDSVKAEIEAYSLEIEEVELELKTLESTLISQTLEKEKEEEKQKQQISALYMNWKNSDDISSFLTVQDDPLKHNYYMEIITETDQEGLNATYQRLRQLEDDIKEVEGKKKELDEKKIELASKQAELEKIVASLQQQEASYADGIRQVKPKISETQSELEFLSAEQKAIQDLEQSLLDGDTGGATKDLVSGEYYFSGRGRDLYQGHGVGLSQWGAYGAGNAGWSASQILTHYYSGVTIGQASGTVNVIGPDIYKNNLDIEAYVAGAGEVPNKACGTAAQAADRPDKYVVDNPNSVWDCWPEEAIKAQMIAYRTYGLRNTNVYNDARSQVYTGTTAKQWAADETRGQVLRYGGSLISAVYSSDNNQGWGTANNDTVWSNYSGDGTAYPYLRAKKDVDFAYRTQWGQWTYRTNSYTIDELNNLLIYSASSGNYSSGVRSFVSEIRGNIGTLRNVELEKDPSGRVNKVKFVGTSGSDYMAGWLFKSIWNIWVDSEKPSGEIDYIYSLTFYFNKS